MSIDTSALKVLFKKIFPPKKCIYTVDTNGDGNTDSILIRAINVIMAFEVPAEIELGGFSTKNFNLDDLELSDYGKIYLDDEPIDVDSSDYDVRTLAERFTIYHKGTGFTVREILSGKLAGRMIAMGDIIGIVIKLDPKSFKKFTLGKHKFMLQSQIVPQIEFNFELSEESLNQTFDPNDF